VSDARGATTGWRVGVGAVLVGLAAVGARWPMPDDPPDPPKTRTYREHVAEPAPDVAAPPPPTGEVAVQVNGPGRVWIDGRAMGSVRWERRFSLPLGAHRVKVVGSGTTVERVVNVEPGGEVEVAGGE